MDQVPRAVQRFLDGMESGEWDGVGGFITSDVLMDCSVPEWRFQYEGRDKMVDQFRDWTSQHPWRVTDARYTGSSDGGVVELEIHGDCPGDDDHAPHEEMARQACVFSLRDGKIAEFRLYCAGEWNEEVMARIDAEAPKVARPVAAR